MSTGWVEELGDLHTVNDEPEDDGSTEYMDAEEAAIAREFYAAMMVASRESPRAKQGQAFVVGVSDLGFCPERVRRMLDGQVPEPTDVLPAFLGTAIGDHAERAYAAFRGEAVVVQGAVEVTFKIRVDKETWTIKVPGHPDIIDRERILMVDCKTDYLLADAERQGADLQKRFQRHLYGVGAWNAGYFPVGTDLSDVRVGNVWIDRSAQDRRVHVDIEPLDLDVVAEAEAWLEDVVYHLINKEAAQKVPPRSMCEVVCLAGETEVVTRQGIRQIGDLVGGKHSLLVPAVQRTGLTWHGQWVESEVKSFGVQPLRKITLTRRRQDKTVYATADHQWFVGDRLIRTDDLVEGTKLRAIRKNNSGSVAEQPIGILHGFVFGDGTRRKADCVVSIFDNSISKPAVMHPRLAGHRRTRDESHGCWTYSGLPSKWKEPPTLSESTGYLTSWLAGYVAADGKVDGLGKVTLSSARYSNVQLVRSICALVGIGYGPVRSEVRPAGRTKANGEHTLYHVTLSTKDLPEWFILNPHHKARLRPPRDSEAKWRVTSVQVTDRMEEVFCAVVPGVEAFALSDGLLTHNCGYAADCRGFDIASEGLIEDPEVLSRVEMYVEGKAKASEGERLKKAAKQALVEMGMIGGSTPDGQQVVWTHVNESYVPEHTRSGYSKLEVKPLPKAKRK